MSNNNKGRHAFLIMTYKDVKLLSRFIDQIDDRRNDIFIHIDKMSDIQPSDIPETRYSNVKILKRYKVVWGGSNLARTELLLLKEAQKGNYDYYHLCSGADLMIKSNDDFHAYFKQKAGTEFIHYEAQEILEQYPERVEQYHIFNQWIRRYPSKKVIKFFNDFDRRLVKLQKIIGIKRHNPFPALQKGCNWFSITHSLATYVMDNIKVVRSFINFSFIWEELFLQSMIYGTEFWEKLNRTGKDNDHLACARYIDWNRGLPYEFKVEDFNSLIDSEAMFARKFNSAVDYTIVERICAYTKSGIE